MCLTLAFASQWRKERSNQTIDQGFSSFRKQEEERRHKTLFSYLLFSPSSSSSSSFVRSLACAFNCVSALQASIDNHPPANGSTLSFSGRHLLSPSSDRLAINRLCTIIPEAKINRVNQLMSLMNARSFAIRLTSESIQRATKKKKSPIKSNKER